MYSKLDRLNPPISITPSIAGRGSKEIGYLRALAQNSQKKIKIEQLIHKPRLIQYAIGTQPLQIFA
tara:strand:- start:33387 stop:33584 length:198 start_codon:yes stop_codon:yes gene_type:complete